MPTVVTVLCARCARPFERRRSDHRFCSPECRKLGERMPGQDLEDTDAIDRLWDPRRDPDERVREDDWPAMTEGELNVYVRCDPPRDYGRAGEGGRRGPDLIRHRRAMYVALHPSSPHASR